MFPFQVKYINVWSQLSFSLQYGVCWISRRVLILLTRLLWAILFTCILLSINSFEAYLNSQCFSWLHVVWWTASWWDYHEDLKKILIQRKYCPRHQYNQDFDWRDHLQDLPHSKVRLHNTLNFLGNFRSWDILVPIFPHFIVRVKFITVVRWSAVRLPTG